MNCLKNGISVIPIGSEKSPLIKWINCIDQPLKEWTFGECNIAILTGAYNGYVVVDCDSNEAARGWLSHMTQTPLIAVSKRGAHFYYRHPGEYVKSDSHIQHAAGFKYDVKGDRSYVLLPPSQRGESTYRFLRTPLNPSGKLVKPESLPRFQMQWRPERQYSDSQNHQTIKNLKAVLKTRYAGLGERDKLTYWAAKLCLEANATESEAIAYIIDWHQTNCSPPWSTQEILQKVQRVYGQHRQ